MQGAGQFTRWANHGLVARSREPQQSEGLVRGHSDNGGERVTNWTL